MEVAARISIDWAVGLSGLGVGLFLGVISGLLNNIIIGFWHWVSA